MDPRALPQNDASLPLLGIAFARLDLDGALGAARARIAASPAVAAGFVCFVNVHVAVEAQDSPELARALAAADLRFADGVPLVWLARGALPGRVCGPDFMSAALADPMRLGVPADAAFGILGGHPGQAARLAARFPRARLIEHSPPFRPFSEAAALEDWEALRRRCPEGPPRVVWVALGAPKQERWMAAVAPRAPGTLFLGIGAALDFLAGDKPRAPRWMQKLGLEWAHRLASEPGRLAGRYGRTNARFLRLALRTLAGRPGS